MAEPNGATPVEKGLVQWARVTVVVSPTQFQAMRLRDFGEYGDSYFSGWSIYVLRRADGLAIAPQGEQQIASAFVWSTGLITHPAFTIPLSAGDEVIMLHPNIASVIAGGVAAILAQIALVRARTDNLAGLAPASAGVIANYHTGVATSGLPGADLVTIGVAGVRNKIHALLVNISAFHLAPAPAASVTVRMYQLVNSVARQVYGQTFLRGTDPDGLWVINGTMGIHEALRVEVYSDNVADDAINCDYDYMLEAM